MTDAHHAAAAKTATKWDGPSGKRADRRPLSISSRHPHPCFDPRGGATETHTVNGVFDGRVLAPMATSTS